MREILDVFAVDIAGTLLEQTVRSILIRVQLFEDTKGGLDQLKEGKKKIKVRLSRVNI